ncbi:MAG: aldo/keto reductase [Blastocatellia bacterium]|nr:aldo/keto reductase [Blastocatellia bacterium]
MKRRTMIGGMAGGALAGLGGNVIAAGESIAQGKTQAGEIPMRTFGGTGVKLTVIGLASGRFHLTGSDEDAIALTRRAVELGINYFDTAHTYWGGHSEEIYGRALPEFRKKVFLTTKSNKRDRKGAEADLEESLRKMKTDYLDLWQVHEIMTLEEVEKVFAPGGAIEAFEAAKKAGKARFIGFTGHRDPEVHLEMLRRYDKWDTILMPLHIADPLYLSFEKQVLPIAIERKMGIQGMKNFGNAKLLQTFSVRECLNYVLSLPIHCTTLGCTTTGQLEDDVRIAKSFKPFAEEQMAALRQRATRIKGPLLEDWKKNTDAKIASLHRPDYVGG